MSKKNVVKRSAKKKGKKPYRTPDLVKHGVLSIIEGD